MRFRKAFLPLFVTLSLVAGTVGMSYAATSTVNGTKYTHPSKYSTSAYKVFHGIDVSYWNYSNDWTKIKNAGVDYAFIRLGYTGSSSFHKHMDSTFTTNINNAYAAGVNVGIYYWSEATTTTEARKEAAYVISKLQAYKVKVTMPVVMDYEFASGFRSTKKYKSWVKKKGKAYARKRVTNNAKAFMDTIKAAGYTPMLYSYRSIIDKNYGSGYHFNMSSINGSNQYKFWLAQYSRSNGYSGNFEYWQYTSSGRVSGTGGTYVDRNFWYYNNSAVSAVSGRKSLENCSISCENSMGYTGSKVEPAITVKDGSTTLKKSTDYVVMYFNNVKAGTAYAIVRGIGKYSDEVLKTFTVATIDLTNNSSISVDSQTYTGTSLTPSPTVKYNGTTLRKDVDYTLSYSNNRNSGTDTATVYATGKGQYYGRISQKFTINKAKYPTISTAKSAYAIGTNGSRSLGVSTSGGALTYSSSSGIVNVSSSGVISSGSSTGSATITINSAAGSNCYNPATRTVAVKVVTNPRTVTLKSVKKPQRKYFRATWKRVSGASGYQVTYSYKKSFSKYKNVRVKSSTATTKKVKDKYSSKSRYVYVKVRAYKTVNNCYIYGNYSKVKVVRVR